MITLCIVITGLKILSCVKRSKLSIFALKQQIVIVTTYEIVLPYSRRCFKVNFNGHYSNVKLVGISS